MAVRKRRTRVISEGPDLQGNKTRPRRAFHGAVYKQPDRIVDAKTKRTMLIDAIIKGNLTRFHRLLASHASPTKCDIFGKTPLHYAAESGNAEMIEALIKAGAFVNARDKNLSTALIDALKSPHPAKTIKLLLSHRADANIPDRHGCVPLHYAAKNCDAESMALLIAATLDPSRKDNAGLTALHHACIANNVQAVAALLAAGVDIFCSDKHGDTALHAALANGSIEAARLILATQNGRLLANSRNLKQQTPLHIAVHKGQLSAVEDLLDVGAFINAVDIDGMSPLAIAAAHHPELLPLLVKRGADVAKLPPGCKIAPLTAALEAKNMQAALFLLENGADPHVFSPAQKETSLMTGLRIGSSFEVIKAMIEVRGDLNKGDVSGGLTVMHIACVHVRLDEIKLMLASKRIDLSVKDKSGRGVLCAAVQYGSKAADVVRLLLAEGLDPLERDNSGDTAYDRAKRIDNKDILRLFDESLKKRGITYKPKDIPRYYWGGYS